MNKHIKITYTKSESKTEYICPGCNKLVPNTKDLNECYPDGYTYWHRECMMEFFKEKQCDHEKWMQRYGILQKLPKVC